MYIIDGDCFLAYLNNYLIFLAPIPTYIYLNYAALVEKNGTLAYPAHALANDVLPVPDGP
jgi:hypothetical protein